MKHTIRAFIAIPLSTEFKQWMTDTGRSIEKGINPGTVRWVRPEHMHLTLAFLGDIESEQVAEYAKALDHITNRFDAFSLVSDRLGCFPNMRRPRVVWVSAHDSTGVIDDLKRQLNQELEPLGYHDDKRSFTPHLTLGRIHRRATANDQRLLGEAVQAMQISSSPVSEVRTVRLVKSVLTPKGPIYTILHDSSLGL